MNPLVFAAWAYALVLAEVAWLDSPLAIGRVGHAPLLSVVLLAYVALHAPAKAVLWAALVVGAVLDLRTPLPGAGDEPATLLGPHVLGMLVGAYALIEARGVIMRDSVLAPAVGTAIVGVLAAVLAAFWCGLRDLIYSDLPGYHPLAALGGTLLDVLYAVVLAVPLGALLHRTRHALGFDARHRRG